MKFVFSNLIVIFTFSLVSAICPSIAGGAVVGSLHGIVHDADHRPIASATVVLQSGSSDYSQKLSTSSDGAFDAPAVPVGAYRVTVSRDGFAPSTQEIVIVSGRSPVVHFQLAVGSMQQTVEVSEAALIANPELVTPTTIISRKEIQTTPGADLTNSLNMITDYVPGAWVTHDQLHVRGGHQVTWAIDGVPIPNTNIASNLGPMIDPKDIDYLEVQRGGYSSEYGDRTYGVLNAVPRTGFERSNEGEIFATLGTFHQTNDHISFGSHTEKFAYFASMNGNRSDYGLGTPGPAVLHDRVWGLGGLGTLIYNPDSDNQFRFVTSLRRDDYQIPNDPTAEASGVRNQELERDAVAEVSWVHTMNRGILLTVSPFYHYNRASFDGDQGTARASTLQQHRASQYGGVQGALTASTARHDASAGFYGFGQRDDESVRLPASDDPETVTAQRKITTGHLEAVFLEDRFKALSWLTLVGGVRFTHFSGAIAENAVSPRLGGSIRLPHLNWVLRGFWGRYYQAPPLSTVTGPLLDVAAAQGLTFVPLKGERDEEHQFGLAIPIHGWSMEFNNYHQRARNYFDHNAIANSNIFFPITVAGARLYGSEVSLRSPQLLHRGEVYVSYAYAHAQGSGSLTGGLTDFSAPPIGYFSLDHDQRHTLHTGGKVSLPSHWGVSGDVYYGSGFTDGSSSVPAHLQEHTTFDLSVSKLVRENLTLSLSALNISNRRFLLDNSQTFGGTHYADPRQVYLQVRYRFKY